MVSKDKKCGLVEIKEIFAKAEVEVEHLPIIQIFSRVLDLMTLL
jgi:hypothetical protein